MFVFRFGFISAVDFHCTSLTNELRYQRKELIPSLTRHFEVVKVTCYVGLIEYLIKF